jgi:hypothetical protein
MCLHLLLMSALVVSEPQLDELLSDNWPIERHCIFESHKQADLMRDDCKRHEWIIQCILKCKKTNDKKCLE